MDTEIISDRVGAERREHLRYPVRTRLDVVVESWSALPVHDVSLGGIGVSMPVAPRVGDRLMVELTLPNGLQLGLAAEVRYVAAPLADDTRLVGLRWIDVADADLLRELVEAVSAVD